MARFYAPAGYGVPMSGDVAYFYEGDTTTPAPIYQDADLSGKLGTSVTANADGGWPNIYLDDALVYKVVFTRSGGSLASPLKSTYPLNAPVVVADGSITADKLDPDAVVDSLGYTPANKAGDTFTGDVLLNFTPVTRDQRSVGFRGSGANNTQNNNYTFALADTGKTTKKTDTSTPTWTIPLQTVVAFAENDILIVENAGSAGSITIARASGVFLGVNGSSSNADYVLTAYSTVALKNVGLNSWRVL